MPPAAAPRHEPKARATGAIHRFPYSRGYQEPRRYWPLRAWQRVWQRKNAMKTLFELRQWAAKAPPGTMLSADVLVEMLDDVIEVEPTIEQAKDTVPPLPWTHLFWTADPETRIGRTELLEALNRPASWAYRHTGSKAENRIPHRKLDGELVFVVGEVRRWLREREEIVIAGPMDHPRPLRAV